MPPSLSPRVTRSSQNLKARQTYGGRPAGFGARKLQIYKEFDEAVAENEKNRKGGGSGSERKRVVGLGKGTDSCFPLLITLGVLSNVYPALVD